MASSAPQLLVQHWPRGPDNDLHGAAREGSTKRTLALLSQGPIDVNQGTPLGSTPLMLGAFNGFPRIVKILLAKGANTSIVADNGGTALHLSSMQGHLLVTTLLVEAGADLEATNCQGFTPLHMAAAEGRYDVLAALIEAGANPNTRLKGAGETPLFTVARLARVDAVKVLLRAKANPLLTTRMVLFGIELVPLSVAAFGGHVDVVRELLQHRGLEGCGGASAGVNALRGVAIGSCSSRVGRLLVEAGVDSESTGSFAFFPTGGAPNETLLALISRNLSEKNINGKDATEEQLNGLEGTRRLLLRVEAVHAVSWLWHSKRTTVAARAPDGKRKTSISTPLSTMMPVLRRRASRPGVFVRPVFR